MKTFFKILITASAFIGGAAMLSAQTVSPGYSGTVAPCTQTLCRPFNQTDLMQIWQAIMYSSKNQTTSVSGTQTVTPLAGSVFTVTGGGTTTVTGNVGGFSKKVHYSVPTSTTAYSIGDNIGGDIFLGTSLSRTGSQGPFIVYEVAFFDSTGHTPDLDVTFLSYPYAANVDNTPAQFTNDEDRYLGNVRISSSDWTVTGTTSRVVKTYVGIICMGIELYAVITTNTAVTFPATTGFNMKIGVLQD